VFDAGELFAGRAANALRGGFRRDQSGEILLQLLKLTEKLVVFAVGDELASFDVIGVIVLADLPDQFGVAGFGPGDSHATRITRIFADGNKSGVTEFRITDETKPVAGSATEWRENAAHGANRGNKSKTHKPCKGR